MSKHYSFARKRKENAPILFSNESRVFLQDYDVRIRPNHVERTDPGSGRLRCSVFCRATTSFAMVCRQTYRETNRWMTLILYFLLRLFGLVGLLSVLVMLDTVTLQLVQERSGESFGAHRLFTSMAFVIFPMISALLMSGVLQLNRAMEFHAAFFLFAVLSVLAMILHGSLYEVTDSWDAETNVEECGEDFPTAAGYCGADYNDDHWDGLRLCGKVCQFSRPSFARIMRSGSLFPFRNDVVRKFIQVVVSS